MTRLLGSFAWSEWIYGILAGFIGGGTSALVSGTAISLTDPKDFQLGSAKTFKLMGIIFAFNGILNALMFLKAHPLPEKVVTVTTTETTVRKTDPPAIVKTTVQETEIKPVEPKP